VVILEAMQKLMNSCIVSGCQSETIHARGCCAACYNAIGAEVRAGRVTWTQLEQAGKCLPARGKIRRHLADVSDHFVGE
jgi:hypothetical protein